MAGDVIYLDIDDEITSAAARIRSVEGRRVAVVLPYGSRVATSRINFRLLSRDAQTHEKGLAIIAGDAATRALAASAGLPVYATVGEYEAAVAAERASWRDEGPADRPLDRSATIVTGAAGVAAAGATGLAATGAATGTPAAAEAVTVTPPARGPEAPASGSPPARRRPPPAADTTSVTVEGTRADAPIPSAGPARGTSDGPPPPVRTAPAVRASGRGIGRTPILVGLSVVALAVVVAGVAAFLLLPSATATVTAREESIGPVSLRIEASTDVTEPDIDAGLVPAETIEIDVSAADTFAATGKRVEETNATGSVRFINKDFLAANTIPKGSVVSTTDGVRFRTDSRVTVPAAELVGLTVIPATTSVNVTAADPGPDGNLPANTIRVIPPGESGLTLEVTNPDATTGGTREEFPRVTQDDVDAAVVALAEQLDAAFADRLDDDDLASADVTVFPETAELGLAVPSVDPATLVGQEVAEFELGATASGTVIAVDAAPVRSIAEARLEASVEPGHQLVDGSSEITESPAVVDGTSITYPVVATARQVAILDPAALEAEILGLPVEDARDVLEAYGAVDLVVWPDWVGTIPTLDTRVEVTVIGPTTGGGPAATDDGASP